jgi:2-methylcitrate dehydratase PrpD
MQRLIALAMLPADAIPDSARRIARFSLFDWMVVGRAGRDQPVARIVREHVLAEGGRGEASLIGGGMAPARGAALANGTISHALDYDDTHFGHIGHPSVGIMPAALAVAESADAPAKAVADAFLLGAEASVRLGMTLGRGHYDRGFHQTATAGAFGATIAAAHIGGLDATRLRHALSLVATRASGLKSQFGTMGKPFNAGVAASNGVEAADLAGRGFVSADDAVGGPQGFIATHSDAPDFAMAWADPPPTRFLLADVKYKLHACCHGTHAMIEALRAVQPVPPDRVRALHLKVSPRWLTVCDLKAPRTGLEVKFSYAFLAGMVFHGIDTAAETAYVDSLARDRRLAEFGARVSIAGDPNLSDTATEGRIDLTDGGAIPVAHDLAAPLSPAMLESGLRAKARALLGAAPADRLWTCAAEIERHSARDLGALLRTN